MKKGLLGSTALIGATAIMAGAASAAEAPTYKISGFLNFQWYITDQDTPTKTTAGNVDLAGNYFGTDDGEIHFNVSGTADNGLTYGFKIELNALQSDVFSADEARISLGGGWGTLLLGDEDGAEDAMNYGGETIMGATGGFDGDQDDWFNNPTAATSFPNIEGDTSDATKATYYSPRFSGFQVGGSWAPNRTSGDLGNDLANPPQTNTTDFQNWIGLGANYDNTFGDIRVRASVVYAMASNEDPTSTVEDIGAYQLGAILGFRGFSWGVNWADNGESNQDTVANPGAETSHWNTAIAWEGGPHYVSLGYFASVYESTGNPDEEYTQISVTYDYSVAPGLGVYAEYDLIEADDGTGVIPGANDGSAFILGTQVSF